MRATEGPAHARGHGHGGGERADREEPGAEADHPCADAEEIVFSFDHQTKKDTNLGLLIDQTAETIVRRIDREGLLAN